MREGNWKLLCEYDWNDLKLFDLSTTINIANDHTVVVYRVAQVVFAGHKSIPKDNEATFKERRRK
jgi:hypothetical protein